MNKFNFNKLTPFKWFVLENFPFIEADFDALTEWQLFCKLGKEMNKIINSENTLGTQMENVTNAFIELQNYVNNYFDNLDVQEEINNKLNQMTEDGTLQAIIESYINLKSILCFNNVAEMKQATNLTDGCFVKTYGFYENNDKGGAFYKITSSAIPNEMTIFALENNLFAVLIEDSQILNAKQLGCHLDKNTDDKEILQNIIDYAKINNKEIILDGFAYVSDTIETKGIKINGIGKIVNPSIVYNSSRFGNIGFDYIKNINNGALITFEDYKTDVLKYGSGIISDIANPIIKCNSKDGQFNLYNLTICGWLRNTNQKGILSTYDSDVSYIHGAHKFENISVINCGGNGIEIQNLETTTFKNNIIKLNGNYGLYINGVNDKDTPTEYSYIIDNIIEGNFNNGIYIQNSFKKLLTIQNNNFSRNGLYHQLNLTPPTDNSVISGVVIENRPSNTSTQNNLIFKSNYGEEIQTLLKMIINNEGNNIINDLVICNNIIYPINNSTSYLAILNGIYYLSDFEISQNISNGGNIINNNTERIGYKQTNIQNIPVTYISSLVKDGVSAIKQGQHVHIEFYGNFNAEVPQYSALVRGLPKSISNYNLHCFAYLINPSTGFYQKTVACVLTTAGTIQTEETIPNGSRISCILDYFCADNVL